MSQWASGPVGQLGEKKCSEVGKSLRGEMLTEINGNLVKKKKSLIIKEIMALIKYLNNKQNMIINKGKVISLSQ